MFKQRLVKLIVLLVIVGGVTAFGLSSVVAGNSERTFVTRLSGDEEVPARDTPARGNAVFHVNNDETEIRFVLTATRLENAFMAHIHIGAFGTNGPIGVWLKPEAPPAPTSAEPLTNGLYARGVFTAEDFVGPLAGMTISDLVDILEVGGAYVNIHTNDFVNPPNTGPGDFPGGEIRGQLD